MISLRTENSTHLEILNTLISVHMCTLVQTNTRLTITRFKCAFSIISQVSVLIYSVFVLIYFINRKMFDVFVVNSCVTTLF